MTCVDEKREGKTEMKPMGINKSVCILTYRNDKLSGKCTRIDDKNHK